MCREGNYSRNSTRVAWPSIPRSSIFSNRTGEAPPPHVGRALVGCWLKDARIAKDEAAAGTTPRAQPSPSRERPAAQRPGRSVRGLRLEKPSSKRRQSQKCAHANRWQKSRPLLSSLRRLLAAGAAHVLSHWNHRRRCPSVGPALNLTISREASCATDKQ